MSLNEEIRLKRNAYARAYRKRPENVEKDLARMET